IASKNSGMDFSTAKLAAGTTGAANFLSGGRIKPDLKTEGGAQGKVERDVKKEMEKNELYKMTGPEADRQNAEAGAWQREYTRQRDLAQQRGGLNFNDANYKRLYESGQAEIVDANGNLRNNGGSRKVVDANETNRRRTKDQADHLQLGEEYVQARNRQQAMAEVNMAAYAATVAALPPGTPIPPVPQNATFNEERWKNETYLPNNPQYITARNAAETVAAAQGQTFNEAQWRDNTFIPSLNDNGTNATISKLRGASREGAPTTLSATQRQRSQQSLDRATEELTTIERVLTQIAANMNGVPLVNVTQEMINNVTQANVGQSVQDVRTTGVPVG